MNYKNLTKEAPRSPHEMLGGFVILARALDKCRASIAQVEGGYNFDCPLDKMLFDFKGTDVEAFKERVSHGATDEEMIKFMKETGLDKTDEEIEKWSEDAINFTYANPPEEKKWFVDECMRLGLNPSTTTLFQYLDKDDEASFAV